MINILLPCMGKSVFYKDSYFPKMLYEVDGSTMLEKVVSNFSDIKNKRFIFIFEDDECKTFHLDDSAKILTGPLGKTIALKHETCGALCTSLMAYDFINNNDQLFISNSDQILDVDFNSLISYFDNNNSDAGTIVFNSIHPRWSYARVINKNQIVEVAEKRPLSNHAIAGFYYYKHGCDFLKAAEKAILKENCVNGVYYLSSSLNELILMNKKIVSYQIEKAQYHSFYSPEKIGDYERSLEK